MEKEIREIKDKLNDIIIRTEYCDGVPDGFSLTMNYNEDLIQKAHYKKGKLDGEFLLYDQNIIIAKINFAEDKRNGHSSYFDKKGNLIGEELYSENIKDGKSIWKNSSGNMLIEENYLKGKLHGERKEYFDNGNIRVKSIYNDGRIVDKPEEFDQKGNKKGEKKTIFNFIKKDK